MFKSIHANVCITYPQKYTNFFSTFIDFTMVGAGGTVLCSTTVLWTTGSIIWVLDVGGGEYTIHTNQGRRPGIHKVFFFVAIRHL